MWRFFLLSVFLLGCGGSNCSPYYRHNFFDQFPAPYAYPFHETALTAQGVHVDTSGLPVDLTAIDGAINSVEECLMHTFGVPAYIPPELQAALECDASSFPLPLFRSDLAVKIAADYTWSCDGKMQLLPTPTEDDSGCLAKGLKPTPDCPCRWRAGIQGNRIIVVTPNLYMLRDPVVRMVTGCNEIWHDPTDTCAMPQ